MSSENAPTQPEPQPPQPSGETQPTSPQSRPQAGPPRPGAPRPGGSTRHFPQSGKKPFPKGEKPLNPGGMPQSLDKREFGAFKPNNRELDKLIEDELAQAMSGFQVESTIAQAETQKPIGPAAPKSNRKKGRILSIHGKDVFVDVPGGRSQGVLPISQFEDKRPQIGDMVEFEVERFDSENGLLLLTREGSVQVVTDWSGVAEGMIVEAKVTDTNKNKTGLLVEVSGIKGFMPASQLDLYRVEEISQFVNQRLKVMVIEVKPEERNLLVSRRAVLEREKQEKAEKFWTTVAEGQVLKGIVRSIKPFGAFVDLGGADGLIPVSEFSWQRVNDLNEFVKVGQQVEVKIARLDHEARKIGLSIKQMTESPFEAFAEQVKAGARVTGKVTRIAEFGAFVELAPGVEGLIHVSQLSTQRVRRVRDVVEEGQTVEVEVLSVDRESRRIALSLKTIRKAEEDAADAAEEVERAADIKSAEERMASRPVNPNLRGGIGTK